MTTLNQQTIDTVKATIPFLSDNATVLTSHFYKRMFEQDPEVKVYFNAAHQASGSQQGALAASVCAFARNIETPENLASAVSLIAHKHVSLGVQPEHYPIVGKHLLASIDELLNPAPKEILEAWGEAYGFLAETLINHEKGLYQHQEWNGFREFVIDRKIKESSIVTSFYLKASDGGKLPSYSAGQYITVRVPSKDGLTTMRNYSLSNYRSEEHLRISVKREDAQHADQPAGYVSHYLHENLSEGDQIEIAAPSGEFTLDEVSIAKLSKNNTPLVLISGGIGITPLLAMLHAVAGKDIPVNFIHGAINSETHAMKQEVLDLAAQHDNITTHFKYSAPLAGDQPDSIGLFELDFIKQCLPPTSEVYFCGPKIMMYHMLKFMCDLRHDPAKVHYEFFGPAEDLQGCPMGH